MKGKKSIIGRAEVQIAVAVAACMLTYIFIPQLQLLSACTGALMCSQEGGKLSMKAGTNRLLGVACSGSIAVVVVLIDNWARQEFLLVGMCIVGILLSIALCKLCGMNAISCRVGCVTFILVIVVAFQEARIGYALNRFIATFYGALVAVVIACVFQGNVSSDNCLKPPFRR